MSASHTSGPLFVGGFPVTPDTAYAGSRRPVPGAKVFYVGSGGGPNTGAFGDGTDPEAPLATLVLALTALGGRTNKGDIIYILPGHAESISTADYFSATGAASGFSVIGLGADTQRGTFTWTAAASTWLLDTIGVELVNLNLVMAATAATIVLTPITVSAANCGIFNCYINWGVSTTIQAGATLGAIAVVAGTHFKFIGNTCINLDVAGTAGGAVTMLSLNGADYAVIAYNKICGATTVTSVGVIHCVTTLSKNITVAHNELENLIASSTVTMSSAISGVTGKSYCNYSRVNSGILAETASANWSVTSYLNYTADTVNLSAALDLAGGAST